MESVDCPRLCLHLVARVSCDLFLNTVWTFNVRDSLSVQNCSRTTNSSSLLSLPPQAKHFQSHMCETIMCPEENPFKFWSLGHQEQVKHAERAAAARMRKCKSPGQVQTQPRRGPRPHFLGYPGPARLASSWQPKHFSSKFFLTTKIHSTLPCPFHIIMYLLKRRQSSAIAASAAGLLLTCICWLLCSAAKCSWTRRSNSSCPRFCSAEWVAPM